MRRQIRVSKISLSSANRLIDLGFTLCFVESKWQSQLAQTNNYYRALRKQLKEVNQRKRLVEMVDPPCKAPHIWYDINENGELYRKKIR